MKPNQVVALRIPRKTGSFRRLLHLLMHFRPRGPTRRALQPFVMATVRPRRRPGGRGSRLGNPHVLIRWVSARGKFKQRGPVGLLARKKNAPRRAEATLWPEPVLDGHWRRIRFERLAWLLEHAPERLRWRWRRNKKTGPKLQVVSPRGAAWDFKLSGGAYQARRFGSSNMLSTKILSSFWSDAEIGELSPPQKLALLWILTNRDTNNLGLAKVSKRQFEFDTGVSMEELESALKLLPRTFPHQQSEHGLQVLAVNYIERQFGDVANVPSNHVYKHLCRILSQSEEWPQRLLLSRYKGLARGFYLEKGDTSPSQATRAEQSGGEQRSTEQNRARGSAEGGPYASIPDDTEVMAFALQWPGEPSSGAPKMPETSYTTGSAE